MFKLMKYEFRKQLFSKIFILLILAVLEVMFLYGLFAENQKVFNISMGLFGFVSFAAVLFVMFEAIFTFSNDLKTKQSYMLFLTPNSTYKIIGAKVLSSVIYVLLTAAALTSITAINAGIYVVKNDEVAMFLNLLGEFLRRFLRIDFNILLVITIILYFLFDLIGMMVIGMASITLSATFLSNTKGKAVVSVGFFVAINFITNLLENLLPSIDWKTMNIQTFYYHCIFSGVVMVVFYFATAFMLDKKVSV